jgi:endonuclease-3
MLAAHVHRSRQTWLTDISAVHARRSNAGRAWRLPGVGRKTANVVLNTAFGEPTLAVDTHVFRVANRLVIAPGKTPREVEDELMRMIPERFLRHAHHWVILHGRYVCKARKPLCGSCVLVDLCPYEPKRLAG